MSYIINKTDGTILATLIDGTSDNTTDLTLIGKNYTGFGEQLNENFVKLLENFSSTSSPSRPLVGQLWYDTSIGRLMVYSLTGWKSAGGPIVTSTQPINFNTGDLWIDNNENQLWFFDGSDLILAGPIWKRTQGKTGFVAETLYDTNTNPKPVLFMYVAGSLMGIYSSSAFTPVPAIEGFTTLVKGFTSNSLINATYNFSTTNSLALNSLTSSQFMRSDVSTINSQRIVVQNNQGISVGQPEIGDFKVSGNTLIIENISAGGDVAIKTNNNTGNYNAIYIDSGTNRIGIFTPTPQQMLDVAGNVRVRGDLIVEGDNFTVNVGTIKVEDKNIELAVVETPTDTTADGAGIIIKGATDKSILYNNGTTAFDVSENLNLAANKEFRIGGVAVLKLNQQGGELTAAITSAPGITSIGPQVNLTSGDIYIAGNTISTLQVNQNIILSPNGTGHVQLDGVARITNVADPVNDQDVATKIYAEEFAKGLAVAVTYIDVTPGGASDTVLRSFLTNMLEPIDLPNDKIATLEVVNLVNQTRNYRKFKITNGAWTALS